MLSLIARRSAQIEDDSQDTFVDLYTKAGHPFELL
jgi:hypothetical protein